MATANDVLKVAESYNGVKEGSARHREILDIYNSHRPLARGYTVKGTDAWCMTFISACFIKANAVEALGLTECGCQEYVNYARKNNMIVNNPIVGDLVFYDWGNDGVVDHVGIIYGVSGYNLFIREGNKSDMVTTRVISKTSPSIKYFVRPKYNGTTTTYDMSKIDFAQSFDRKIAGEYVCTASDFVALRYNPYVEESDKKNNKIAEIKKGETCHNYGYFTNDWLLVVYKGKTGFANKMHLRKKV